MPTSFFLLSFNHTCTRNEFGRKTTTLQKFGEKSHHSRNRPFFFHRMPRLARWSYVWSGREIWHLKWRLPRMGYVHGLTGYGTSLDVGELLNVFFSALLDEFDEWTLRERIKWVSEMISTYIYIYVYLYTKTYIYRYTYILISTYTHTYTYTYIHIYTYTSILMHMYDTYMYACTYTYTDTHIHRHMIKWKV